MRTFQIVFPPIVKDVLKWDCLHARDGMPRWSQGRRKNLKLRGPVLFSLCNCIVESCALFGGKIFMSNIICFVELGGEGVSACSASLGEARARVRLVLLRAPLDWCRGPTELSFCSVKRQLYPGSRLPFEASYCVLCSPKSKQTIFILSMKIYKWIEL